MKKMRLRRGQTVTVALTPGLWITDSLSHVSGHWNLRGLDRAAKYIASDTVYGTISVSENELTVSTIETRKKATDDSRLF